MPGQQNVRLIRGVEFAINGAMDTQEIVAVAMTKTVSQYSCS